MKFRLAIRDTDEYHPIYSTGKLGQFYTMDTHSRIMENRLAMVREHNMEMRREKKSNFFKSMDKRFRKRGERLGMLVTLPKTFVGSPRYYRKKYEDTIAMINEHGTPDLFLTFTGNRCWKELTRYIKKGESWADKAMLAARVFSMKFKAFLDDITKKKHFGKVACWAYSIEVQKRGMLHAHVLLTLDKDNKLDSPEKVDKYISAVIPPERPQKKGETDEQYKQYNDLRELVIDLNVHTPCEKNQDAYCRKGCKPFYRRCNKRFPYDFLEETTFNEDGYVQIRRPDDGVKVEKVAKELGKKVVADNRYVVPYSPTLTLRYQSHINVEVCSTVKAVKYIFKYIFKGVDKALVEFTESSVDADGSALGRPGVMTAMGQVILPSGVKMPRSARRALEDRAKRLLKEAGLGDKKVLVYDEPTLYKEMRSWTPGDSCWGIKEEKLTRMSHVVVALAVHLVNQESVWWKTGGEASKRRSLLGGCPTSQLTAFFDLCRYDEDARELTYPEVPKFYRWDKPTKQWIKRKKKTTKIVTRIYTVRPKFRELFALRLLVQKIKGPQCFDDLKTLPTGEVVDTFQEAARARNLMNDENEWHDAMQEASTFSTPVEMRRLFANILLFTEVKNPEKLWEDFEKFLLDRKGKTLKEKQERALAHVNSILEQNGTSLANEKLFVDVDISHFAVDDGEEVYSKEEARQRADEMAKTFNRGQMKVVQRLKKAVVEQQKGGGDHKQLFFLQGFQLILKFELKLQVLVAVERPTSTNTSTTTFSRKASM